MNGNVLSTASAFPRRPMHALVSELWFFSSVEMSSLSAFIQIAILRRLLMFPVSKHYLLGQSQRGEAGAAVFTRVASPRRRRDGFNGTLRPDRTGESAGDRDPEGAAGEHPSRRIPFRFARNRKRRNSRSRGREESGSFPVD